ncbi:BA75_00916T0 [Komagataella pastoris]|uniref:BA75_00916T0 n=1 Tax=Komagataella pastoris TaxID=4922 RepID=A0A1B2J7G4_PICPA|nr:BA75_00916T0 [Komagataella pastoris]
MGAWGTDVFDDDTSLDVFDDLMKSKDQAKFVVDSLTAPVPQTLDDGEIDYSDSFEKMISAILLAIWLDFDTKFPLAKVKYSGYIADRIEETYGSVKDSPDFQELKKQGQFLKDQAKQWLKSLSENPELSELCELWMENSENYKEWKENIDWVIDFVS